jgi:hypothetical protein
MLNQALGPLADGATRAAEGFIQREIFDAAVEHFTDHSGSDGSHYDSWGSKVARRERAALFFARVALDAPARGRSTSPLAAMGYPRALFGVLVAFASVACSPPSYGPVDLKSISGLWRYPNRQVWIEVSDDGSLFECRRPREGSLIVSRGHFTPPHSFAWDAHWGTEQIEYLGGVLTIHHAFVTANYIRPDVPMSQDCREASTHGS